jgi:2-polyprenyl-3-methyl-5-hydroxy-6-metoxy-1,4-benzoquinol methylase
MPDFSSRSQDLEIMDDLACSGEVVNQTLRELDVINRWLGGNSITIQGVARLLKDVDRSRPLTLVDVGCGSGDMLRQLVRWAKKNRFTFNLIGIDANPNIITFAQKQTGKSEPITFEALDIFSETFQSKEFDIVIGTLFYHHFSHDQLVYYFKRLQQQIRVGIIINDLHRNAIAYYSIKWLTYFFSRSSMVKFDAPLSVLRGFTKREITQILHDAGIKNFEIRWRWAFRWQVIIRK